jgi:2,3-bisphosphoglycerate-independent phosphoglycerate mutase
LDFSEVWEGLVAKNGGKIVYIILDGVGGLPHPEKGGTELQVAKAPALDALARESSCGLLEMVGPGITPGSGPGHLALFGYDPFKYNLGRGILSALGIDFQLQTGDVAARINFATLDQEGHVTDRRAGRIESKTNQRLCKKIKDALDLDMKGEFFLETVSEHRALLVLRGQKLGGNLQDTDPQQTGAPPLEPEPLDDHSRKTSEVVRSFIAQVRDILSDEDRANMVLLRGFDKYQPFPSLKERFGLSGVCIAEYPMYRGVCRLLGMEVPPPPQGLEKTFDTLDSLYGKDFDFYFLHVKKTDSAGEDGDFDKKVKVIEWVDKFVPKVANVVQDVLVVTGDHSTPSSMKSHSWHPVPVILRSPFCRVDSVSSFDEIACSQGTLGTRPGMHLMGLALAHAGRLKKYGA